MNEIPPPPRLCAPRAVARGFPITPTRHPEPQTRPSAPASSTLSNLLSKPAQMWRFFANLTPFSPPFGTPPRVFSKIARTAPIHLPHSILRQDFRPPKYWKILEFQPISFFILHPPSFILFIPSIPYIPWPQTGTGRPSNLPPLLSIHGVADPGPAGFILSASYPSPFASSRLCERSPLPASPLCAQLHPSARLSLTPLAIFHHNRLGLQILISSEPLPKPYLSRNVER